MKKKKLDFIGSPIPHFFIKYTKIVKEAGGYRIDQNPSISHQARVGWFIRWTLSHVLSADY